LRGFIREIARDLGVSRNTVRKVLRSGETSFEYERTVQPRPKLGRWTTEVDELLESNTAKPAREQLTLIRIFEEFRERGYDGGYDALRRYARRTAVSFLVDILDKFLARELLAGLEPSGGSETVGRRICKIYGRGGAAFAKNGRRRICKLVPVPGRGVERRNGLWLLRYKEAGYPGRGIQPVSIPSSGQ
jgi:hypothetical protein